LVSVFYVTLLVLTTLIWGYIFYKKDYHPQPLKVIVQSFFAGLFAMAPVFAYKYIYQNYIPALAEYKIFRPLLDYPLISGLAVFVINLITLSLILFILSGVLSLILSVFNHSTIINLKNAIKDEPLGFTVVSLLLGAAISLESLAQKVFSTQIIGTVLGSILFLAIIEEYIKHLIVKFIDDKKLKDIDDAITLSIIVGLAFAFIETIFYSVNSGEIRIIFYRVMVSLPVHLVASGIFGYYYGYAHFAKPIMEIEGGDKTYRKSWLPSFLKIKKSTIYDDKKITEGILFATLFHASMNLLFEFNLGFIAVPFIVLGVVVIFYLYKTGIAESVLIRRFRQKNLNKLKTIA